MVGEKLADTREVLTASAAIALMTEAYLKRRSDPITRHSATSQQTAFFMSEIVFCAFRWDVREESAEPLSSARLVRALAYSLTVTSLQTH